MLIGLSGYAQSGKDTVGRLLIDDHGFTRYAFGDRMKEVALTIDPIMDWYNSPPAGGRPVRLSEIVAAVGWDAAKKNEEVRRLLQRIGTEAGRRTLGEDVWVDLTFGQIAADAHCDVVVTDVRFINEAARIRSELGVTVRIERPGVLPPNDHVSEHDLKDWVFDYQIDNDGTVVDLAREVDALLEEIGE